MVTRLAKYPILRCNDAVMYGFGEAMFFILLDAQSGYHQMKLSEASMLKTAFFAPQAFVAMMHDLKEMWMAMAKVHGIDASVDNGTTIIIDDNFIYRVLIEHTFLMTCCVCLIAQKNQLTWQLKKSQCFPFKFEFVVQQSTPESISMRKEARHQPNPRTSSLTIGTYQQLQDMDSLYFI
jgi:hypothetical protein